MTASSILIRLWRRWCRQPAGPVVLALLLAGCGGGEDDDAGVPQADVTIQPVHCASAVQSCL